MFSAKRYTARVRTFRHTHVKLIANATTDYNQFTALNAIYIYILAFFINTVRYEYTSTDSKKTQTYKLSSYLFDTVFYVWLILHIWVSLIRSIWIISFILMGHDDNDVRFIFSFIQWNDLYSRTKYYRIIWKKMTKSFINGTFCFVVYKERQNKIVKPTLEFVHTINRKSIYLHFTCTC